VSNVVLIDIPADLNMEDDQGRNLAPVPDTGTALTVGSVAVAGRRGFWSWVVVEELGKGVIYFRQVTAREAARHGDLVAPLTA
jgi:hypothetical protein